MRTPEEILDRYCDAFDHSMEQSFLLSTIEAIRNAAVADGLGLAAEACDAKAKSLLSHTARKLSRGLDHEDMAIDLRRMQEKALNGELPAQADKP